MTAEPACTCLTTAALVARGLRNRDALPPCEVHAPAPPAPVALNDGPALARLIGASLHDTTTPANN